MLLLTSVVARALRPEYSPPELPRMPVESSFGSHFEIPSVEIGQPLTTFVKSPWVAVTRTLPNQPLGLDVSMSETCVRSVHSPSYIRELIEQTFDIASSIAATSSSLYFSITLNTEILIEIEDGSGKPNRCAMSETQIAR